MTQDYPAFLAPAETLPRPQLRILQEQRLLSSLRQAWRYSPLLRSIWERSGVHPDQIKSIEDFQSRAPFFDKDDIRHYRDAHNDPLGGMVELNNPLLQRIASTSGTTGDPTPMPIRFQMGSQFAFMRDFWHMGARPGDYIVMPVFTFRGGVGNGAEFQRASGLIPIFINHTLSDLGMMIEAIYTYKPTIFGLISTPLILAFEQFFAKNKGIDPKKLFACVKGTIYGGEAISPRLRRLTDSWGLELYQTTALGDMVSGVECSEHSGFHCFEDLTLVECLDLETGQPVADGELGELVVTSIHDPLLSMVRFRTDDLVTMDSRPCACGRTHAKFHIKGRKGDRILVQGKPMLPVDIRFVLEEKDETSAGLFQIIKTSTEMEVLALRVGFNGEKLSCSEVELQIQLEKLVGDAMGVPTQVELIPDAELLKLGPPHKIPRVTKQ